MTIRGLSGRCEYLIETASESEFTRYIVGLRALMFERPTFQRSFHLSANLVVDLANTTDYRTSLMIGSGSNTLIGEIVDLLHADTYCNLFVAGGAGGGSGAIQLQVQTSDATTSGSFTDPTSGLASMPGGSGGIASGGNFYANSGLWSSGNYSYSSPCSGAPLFCSGGIQFAAFQRPGRYARLLNVSGPYTGAITAGFISQKKVTGSGPGYSFSPSSGAINV